MHNIIRLQEYRPCQLAMGQQLAGQQLQVVKSAVQTRQNHGWLVGCANECLLCAQFQINRKSQDTRLGQGGGLKMYIADVENMHCACCWRL